eukprot:sb/3470220/
MSMDLSRYSLAASWRLTAIDREREGEREREREREREGEYRVFRENLAEIVRLNEAQDSYRVGVNFLADLTPEEQSLYQGLNATDQDGLGVVGATGTVDPVLPVDTTEALLSGAVAVAFKVESGFNYYKKGIYKDPSCPQRSPSHAVLATGYGPNYIWVKNSWGVGWGDKGYIKFARIGFVMFDIFSLFGWMPEGHPPGMIVLARVLKRS